MFVVAVSVAVRAASGEVHCGLACWGRHAAVVVLECVGDEFAGPTEPRSRVVTGN